MLDVLHRLRREQLGQVTLAELRERIQQRLGGAALAARDVQRLAAELNPDQYLCSNEGGDEVIYFV